MKLYEIAFIFVLKSKTNGMSNKFILLINALIPFWNFSICTNLMIIKNLLYPPNKF